MAEKKKAFTKLFDEPSLYEQFLSLGPKRTASKLFRLLKDREAEGGDKAPSMATIQLYCKKNNWMVRSGKHDKQVQLGVETELIDVEVGQVLAEELQLSRFSNSLLTELNSRDLEKLSTNEVMNLYLKSSDHREKLVGNPTERKEIVIRTADEVKTIIENIRTHNDGSQRIADAAGIVQLPARTG